MCEQPQVLDQGNASARWQEDQYAAATASIEAGCEDRDGLAPIRRRPNWPFLYYQHNGKLYRNPVKRETKSQQLAKIEDALL